VSTSVHPGLNLGQAHGSAHDEAEIVVFGFWVFLMSDLVTFGMFFATYATMRHALAGGPVPGNLFDLLSVALQTALLLTSSLTFGFASLAMKYRPGHARLVGWLIVTALLGLAFLGFELADFARMAARGATPQRSGWLSSFYALVGLHGLHVSAGLVWIAVMLCQIRSLGLTNSVKTRLLRLGLYWHFLDIVWIGIFSVVFLGGIA
jgi:cytochrome o ubiquinol oxidase subunit 3